MEDCVCRRTYSRGFSMEKARQKDREVELQNGRGVMRKEGDEAGAPSREARVEQLQRAAGNRAVSSLISVQRADTDVLPNLPDVKQETNAVTSLDTIKDAWGHLSSLFHHEKKEGEKGEEGDE